MYDRRAGNAEVFAQTCSGLCTDLIADPANYNNVSEWRYIRGQQADPIPKAYFELASIKTYTGAP